MLRTLAYGTHDNNNSLTGLVIAKLFDKSSGSPVLHTTTALVLVTNGGYEIGAEIDPRKPFYADIRVYETTTAASIDANYVSSCFDIPADNAVVFAKNYSCTGFIFPMFDRNGEPAEGLAVTAMRSVDGAAFSACANAVVEISRGKYKINFEPADLNGDKVHFEFSADGCVNTEYGVFPK